MHIYFHIVFLFLASLSVAISSAQDITLMDYYMSECQGQYREEIDRVSEINSLDSGLTEIVLSVKGNCSMLDSITVTQRNDSILFNYGFLEELVEYSSYYVYGVDEESELVIDSTLIIDSMIFYSFASCDCCFTFNLTISGYDHSTKYIFIGNGKEIPITTQRFPLKPISFEVLDGDTINYSDLYGFRQGRWILYNEKGLVEEDAIYENSLVVSGKTDIEYDENNKLVSEWDGGKCWKCSQLFYYPSGNLKRKCFGLYPEKCEDFPDKLVKKKRKIK